MGMYYEQDVIIEDPRKIKPIAWGKITGLKDKQEPKKDIKLLNGVEKIDYRRDKK